MLRKLVAASVLTTLVTTAAAAMTVKEFKKFTVDEQSLYIGAQVSMLMYAYATDGNTEKRAASASGITGHQERKRRVRVRLRSKIAVAEQRDAEKYHVEGIILGLTDQVCGKPAPASGRK